MKRPSMVHYGRFLTLHRRRKKKPPTRAIQSEQALLDDLYLGPIHVLFFKVYFRVDYAMI